MGSIRKIEATEILILTPVNRNGKVVVTFHMKEGGGSGGGSFELQLSECEMIQHNIDAIKTFMELRCWEEMSA